MGNILLAWAAGTDHKAAETNQGDQGPVLHALSARRFDRVMLLHNYEAEKGVRYLRWLKEKSCCPESTHLKQVSLKTAVDYESIYRICKAELERLQKEHPEDTLHLHLSPGTGAMQTVWVLLAYSRSNVRLVSTSKEEGFKEVELPFEVAVDFLPDSMKRRDERLLQLASGLPPEAPAFEDIIRSDVQMEQLVTKARIVAMRDVPVLIEGESGTGKELLAGAIHRASLRAEKKFIPVNCGAIPENLIESQFFGYAKGAFTGATADTPGYLEAAQGGTLFLDEIGEMPLPAQVRLLRALQEKKVTRLGETRERAIDVRVIAATNRRLMKEVAEGRFREDLFHRLAVAILNIPPLRERGKDIDLVADSLLKRINAEADGGPGYKPKKISVGARKRLKQHRWPGNVRELNNTLLRASIWTQGEELTQADIEEAILPTEAKSGDILGRPLDEDFDIDAVIEEVSVHYIERALAKTHGNKAEAARLLGLASATTLTNRMNKHGIEQP